MKWIFPMPGLPSSAASFGVPIGAPTPRGRGPRNGRSGGHRSGGGAGARRDKDEDQDMAGGGGGLFDFSWPYKKGGWRWKWLLGMYSSKVGGELIGMVVGLVVVWVFFWGGCLAFGFEVCLESCFCLAWFFFFGSLEIFWCLASDAVFLVTSDGGRSEGGGHSLRMGTTLDLLLMVQKSGRHHLGWC